MKYKGFIAFVVGAALLANMAVFSTSFAITGESQGAAEAQGGVLSITSFPASVDFGSTAVSNTNQTISYTFTTSEKVQWSDARDNGQAFNLNARATDFSDGSHAIDSSNFKIRVSGPGTITQETGGGANGCDVATTGQSTLTAFNGADPISGTVSLVAATATTTAARKFLDCSIRPEVEVTIPSYQTTGIYNTSVYWVLS